MLDKPKNLAGSKYIITRKSTDKGAITLSSFSDNVIRIDKFNKETTPGELEDLTGATVVRRVKDGSYVDKTDLGGKYTLPEDFEKDLGLPNLVKITQMEINGDKASFVYRDRENEKTIESTLEKTVYGYGFTADVEKAEDINKFITVQIVEAADNYITLVYKRTNSLASETTTDLAGATLVKAQ